MRAGLVPLPVADDGASPVFTGGAGAHHDAFSRYPRAGLKKEIMDAYRIS
ncbi:MAG: hypothetical protein CM15mP120_20770 [Pseudomonadota bacterium]|nr:MAG: hypothetical protein CM15mP120_20770 [Pseudomonadota bacterium]